MASFLVGLTGGLASGKSTVAGWMREAGFTVVDADQVVADLYRPGARGAAAVAELFGDDYLTADGAVDRESLAGLVFAKPEARRRLEAAIHPLVREHFGEMAASVDGIAVYEATLMVESGHSERFDLVVSIEAPVDRRLSWAVARGMDETAAKARLAAQGDGTQRRAGADRIVDNDGTLEDLRAKIDDLVDELRNRAADASSS